MNNYYKILQVDKEASEEVIEKAYKTLVKKYHPDLQSAINKTESENMMKIINQAYSVLSNKEKRAEYDIELRNFEEQEIEKQIKLKQAEQSKFINEEQEKRNLKSTPARSYNPYQNKNAYNNSTYNNNFFNKNLYNNNTYNSNRVKQTFKDAYRNAYNDAYTSALRNMGYKIKYKKTFKDYIRIFITLVIIIFICFILWHIPFIRNFLLNIYNNSVPVKLVVDILINIVNSFIDTITNISLLL